MRVAIVHSFYKSSEPSGENAVVLEQVEALASAGHDVRVIRRDTDHLIDERGYGVRSALTTLSGRGASPEESLEEFKPDVVHLHNTFPNWGTSWLKHWGAKTVVTLHNYRLLCTAGTFYRDGHACTECLVRASVPAVVHACYKESRVRTLPLAIATRPGGAINSIGRRAATLITLNAEAQEIISNAFDRKVELLPNFVFDAKGSSSVLEKYLVVGRFAPEKGVVELIRAWPESRSLDVIGAGPLEARVRDASGLLSNVQVSSPLPRAALMQRLGSYRALVVPSLWTEGLPTVVLEALARGVPIVLSSRVAASTGLVRAGAAVPYDPDVPAALLAALEEVEARGESMRVAARALHASDYSRSKWLGRIEQVYREVVAS